MGGRERDGGWSGKEWKRGTPYQGENSTSLDIDKGFIMTHFRSESNDLTTAINGMC